LKKKSHKLDALIPAVLDYLGKDAVRFMPHALERLAEREITRPEVFFVLKTGKHERAKDRWDETFGMWHYAIRGKTLDGKDLRIVVSVEEPHLLIITTIDLSVQRRRWKA